MKTGWEIKPLGWVALIALVAIVIYFIFFHGKPKKEQNE
jgi:hypothetical protein